MKNEYAAVFRLFVVACLILTITGCSPKQATSTGGQSTSVTPQGDDAIESAYMLPRMEKTTAESKNCSTCDVKPGDLPAFNKALMDVKVQRYTDGGTTKIEHKIAETFCDKEFFSTCDGLMIIQATDEKSDRVELRQEKNLGLTAPSIMRFQAKFENLPNASASKGVTLAQIHNDASGVGRPLLRVEYTGENELRVVVTDTYVKGAGTSTNDYMVTFKDGDELYCKLEMTGNDDEVRVFIKNMNTGKSKSKAYTVNSTWKQKDGDFYYKTGAYLQESGKSPRASYSMLQFNY
ncbi:MAG: polysaccharide lyase family 7 protein [Nonlabens sp.]|nr:polysaccharide lyase family 7 protein [Nonlabens sp.]